MNMSIFIDDKKIELEEKNRKDFADVVKCLLTTAVGPGCEWNKASIEINRKTE